MIDKKTNNFKGCTVNSGSDFSTVKVGDRLWLRDNFYEGWVEVVTIYPTCFKVSAGPSFEHWLSKSGKWADDGPQVLFYDKVEIVPPPRPRRMVKKTVMVRPYLSGTLQGLIINPTNGNDTEWCGPVQTIVIEVEEEK